MTAAVQFEWLRKEFETLVSAYRYPERAGDYAAWETWLAGFPPWVVQAVVFQAPDRWPSSMPTVGELRRAVAETLAKRRSAERDSQPKHQPETDGPMSSHMQPGFRKMADNITRESKRLGLNPDQESPHDVGLRRIRSIRALFNKHSQIETLDGEGVDLQPNPKGKRRRPPA